MSQTTRSFRALDGVRARLAGPVLLALQRWRDPFYSVVLTEGLRTLDRQKALVAEGASQTLASRHLTGNAVDFAILGPAGQVVEDLEVYHTFSVLVRQAERDLFGEPPLIVWGGSWKSLVDGCHLELPVQSVKGAKGGASGPLTVVPNV